MPPSIFPLRSALALALACAFTLTAHASDHADHGDHAAPEPAKAEGKAAMKAEAKSDMKADMKADAKAEAKADMKAKAEAKGEPAMAAKPAAAKDPMDLVRERLAEKLGARKPPEAPNPNVLRVVSRASSAETPAGKVAAGHAAPARATRRPMAEPEAAPAHGAAEAAPAVTTLPMMAVRAAHWDYSGAGGPETWGQLQPEFSKCSSGTRQSPIDIRDGVKVQLDEVQFDYKPSGFRVIDNGHTVQVNVGSGNGIEVLGRRYELIQFHFHRPSEERVNGRQFDMVAHLVHKDLDGRLAVVAVLLDRGSAQPLVQAVWNNLPLEKGEEVAAQQPIDLNTLLPTDRSYYTYMGSLTTPPCSEGVLWMVMKNPVQVSQQQIAIFSRLYPMNARPVQQASGRLIKESN